MLKVLSLATLLGTAAMAEIKADTNAFTAAQKEEINNSIKEYIKSNPQKEEINNSIKEYIQNHPQEVIKALQDFSEKQQKEALEKMQASVAASTKELTDPKNAIVIGNPEAPVKAVIFVDPNCPHCRVFEAALGEIEKDLPKKDNLCILIRQWPILGDNSKAVAAGLIAANVQDSKKIQILSEKLIKSGSKPWDIEQLLAAAKEAGYDDVKIKAATKDEAILGQIKNTSELATKIGLEATPTLILADKKGARLIQVGDKDGLKKLLIEAVTTA